MDLMMNLAVTMVTLMKLNTLIMKTIPIPKPPLKDKAKCEYCGSIIEKLKCENCGAPLIKPLKDIKNLLDLR